MKPRMLSRRKFIAATLLATPLLAVGDARLLEPTWLKTRHVKLNGPKVGCRCVHFTDIHHKGDRDYLQSVVDHINSLSPDFVCFTGDLIEHKQYLQETLDTLSGIQKPLFGVPGNHDYWSGASFATINKYFTATGGGWLLNEHRSFADGRINLIGITHDHAPQFYALARPQAKNIVLMHYPAWAKRFDDKKFDLLLAGHSHGGQVRLPFYGPLYVPYETDEYDLGLFQTPAGPLYVNPGIGYLHGFNIRFNCRPEITVFDV